MNEIVNAINGVIWSPALIYLCLGVGLYFSLRSRFLQLRHLKGMIRLMFQGKGNDAGVSSFQALSMTLAGRVGTGNIAGVATAITFGGPGALFWMWMVAFLAPAPPSWSPPWARSTRRRSTVNIAAVRPSTSRRAWA